VVDLTYSTTWISFSRYN